MTKTVLLAALIAVGCAAEDEGKSISWGELHLAGKALELVDEKKVESLYFSQQGTVSAELGVRGGQVTGPSWFWRIENDRLIISEAPGGSAELQLYRPRLNGKVLTAQRNFFQAARYQVKE